jgi:PhnB protein
MSVEAYINFGGNCREAVLFYAEVFGTAPPQFMTFADGDITGAPPLSEEQKSLIMHTDLTIAGTRIMFSDTFPGMPLVVGNNISLTYISKDMAEQRRLFDVLKVGGRVEMEMGKTFWSPQFGSLVDKFGIAWQFDVEE